MAKQVSYVTIQCRRAQSDYAINKNAASGKIEKCEENISHYGKREDIAEAIQAGNLHRAPSGNLYIQLMPRRRSRQELANDAVAA